MTASKQSRYTGTLMTRLKRQIANNPLGFVENLSNDMVKRLGKTEPPFQTEAYEYAALAGAKVLEANITSSGVVSVFNGRIIIEVNRNHPLERKNYTVCHEVGHIELRRAAKLLPPPFKTTMCAGEQTDDEGVTRTEEWMVRRFAANILMPREVFRKKAEPLVASLDNAMVLANMFKTSLGATLRRIASLGVWQCVMIWGIPEKMKGDDEWALKIHEFRSCIPDGPVCPQHKYVWWGAKAVKKTMDSPSMVKEIVPIDGKSWCFEGLREWHYTGFGERENRIMALLLPDIS
jgi:Zn-dependent peptidase ImmA (M78 family)